MRIACDSDSRCGLACDASARDAKSLAMWVERCEPLKGVGEEFAGPEKLDLAPKTLQNLSGSAEFWVRVLQQVFYYANLSAEPLQNPKGSAEFSGEGE